MPVRESRVQSGAVSLAVQSRGDAARTPVVLVHGYPDSSRVWRPVAERLAERYHVIAYDVRGAGGSDAPEHVADYRLELLAEDLRAVTDALCPHRPFHLVAHDWGAIQSWEAVTAESMHSRIASYTAASGPCLDHVGFWLRRRLLRPTPKNLAQVFGQLVSSWYIYMFHLPWLMPLMWRHVVGRRWHLLLRRMEGVVAEASPTQVRDGELGIKLYRANIFQRLLFPRRRHATMPVQLLVPLHDPHVRPQLADELLQWAPRLWRRDIPAGHWLPLSHPDWFAECVSEFVEFVERGQESAGLRQARVA